MWSSLGDESLPDDSHWVSEPNNRGTYSILSSCLLTLALCVWSCLHLNVPEQGDGYFRRVLKKTKWMVIGLLAPEVVAFFAACQWREQRNLSQAVQAALAWRNPTPPARRRRRRRSWRRSWPARLLRRLRRQPQNDNDDEDGAGSSENGPRLGSPRLYAWTATHSFLALMGGFAFDNSRDPAGYPLPGDRQRLTILPDGIVELARRFPDVLPDLAPEAIADKSKTSAVVKLAACVQALWFCAQMIARMAQHLPLTMLELVTFAHALCAIFVYAVWWHKPQDVEEPFLIDLARGSEAAAACTDFCGNHVWRASAEADKETDKASSSRSSRISHEKSIEEASPPPPPSPPAATVLNQHDAVEFVHILPIMGTSWWLYRFEYWRVQIQRAGRVLRGGSGAGAGAGAGPVPVTRISTSTVAIRRDNLSHGISSSTALALALVHVAYNSWHLTAWAGPFPSATAQLLWRVAATGPSGLVLLLIVLHQLRSRPVFVLFEACVGLTAVAMLASRMYLVGESLAGLGRLPPGALQQPDWSPYFPHIG